MNTNIVEKEIDMAIVLQLQIIYNNLFYRVIGNIIFYSICCVYTNCLRDQTFCGKFEVKNIPEVPKEFVKYFSRYSTKVSNRK